MKTPVLIEAYKQANAGKFSINDSLTVKNEFRSIVDGSIYSLDQKDDSETELYTKAGKKLKIYDLLYLMIIQSSNLATVTSYISINNIFFRLFGLGINCRNYKNKYIKIQD